MSNVEAPELVQPISVLPQTKPLLKIDLGSGPNVRDGFEGVDILPFDGKVKHVVNLVGRGKGGAFKPWPWSDKSVEEAHCSHMLEHITNLGGAWERVHFFNELYRVLVPGGKCTIIIPHWASARYYGDPTHKEPFSEWGFFYLNREWRLGNKEKGTPGNAPHDDISHSPHGYSCDFDYAYGHILHPSLVTRNQEYQNFALTYYKEAAQDLIGTVTARK